MTVDIEAQIVEEIGAYACDPLGYINFAFPWGENAELAGSTGPYSWQAGVSNAIGAHLQNPLTRFTPLLIAVSSGHGIGKSAYVGMISQWAMSTCRDCRINLTANSEPQLRTKTWPEIGKWFRLAINNNWFDVQAETIRSSEAKYSNSWRMDRLTWSVQNPQAFAGLHNFGKRIIVIFDEASEIDDQIWTVQDGVLTDKNTEIIWLVFSNPTQNVGRFRECFGRFKHRWKTIQIDSRNVENTNKEEIEKWIADYGEDSDFVRVKVRGEFPRAGSAQYIPSNAVAACRKYKAQSQAGLPKILGVDVARFGEDSTVLFLRQGRHAEIVAKYEKLDTAVVTAHVIEAIKEHCPQGVVVDSDGVGSAVYDQLKFQGYGHLLLEFHGAKPAYNPKQYFNRRTEVWGKMRDWLAAGGQIPDLAELEQDLIGPRYGFSPQQQVMLERKDDLKARGLNSPDLGDALAYTFAVELLAPPKQERVHEYYSPGEREYGWLA